MKRAIGVFILFSLPILLFANGNKEKVLLFVRYGTSSDMDFVVDSEANVMIGAIEKAGFKVVTASDSGEPIMSQKEFGKTLLRPELKISDAKGGNYAGIIMPCLSKESVRPSDPREIVRVIREANSAGKPVAAQHASMQFLAEAGVLDGRRAAYNPSIASQFSMAIFGKDEVVRDGNVVTSSWDPAAARYYGATDGTLELTRLFIEAIRDSSKSE